MLDSPFIQDARHYLALAHRRRGLILTCVGTSFLAATLYNYTTRPIYQATVQILIDRDTPKVLPIKQLVELGSGDYQTEYQLLRGRTLTEKVVERLDLQKSPELQAGPTISPWERFQRKFLGKPDTPPVDSDGMPLSPAVATIQSRLTVQPMPGGRLVNVRFNAYDPALAAQVVNTLAQVYIEQSIEFRYTTTSEASSFLSDRLRDQKRKLEDAEKVLQEFRKTHSEMNFDDQGGVPERVRSIEEALLAARMQRMAKESLQRQLSGLSAAQLATSPTAMTNGMVQDLRRRISDLRAQQAQLGETLGDKHPDMVRVRAEIKSAEDKLYSEGQNVLRSVQVEYQLARDQEASLLASLEGAKRDTAGTSSLGVEYNAMKREVETNRQIFDNLMSRAKETGLESELKSSNIKVVEKAEAPTAPILPRRTRNYQIALLVGLVLGVGLSLLFENLDSTLKTPEDVKQALGLPFLGMVPEVALRGVPGDAKRSPLLMKNPDASQVADSYRILRTNLIFSNPDAKGSVLLVSSTNPGEGKTTTVANLAGSLAQNGAKVLVIDADLRRPTVHQVFNLSKLPGLTDLIVGKAKTSEVIRHTPYKGLQVIPCGYIPPNPTELLGSTSMREVVRALRTHYDWVLIDTPPILAMADTAVLCPVVDGAILVVGAEQSNRNAIQRAVDQVQSVGGKVMGVVLNRVNLDRNSYYYGQYYGEYYRSYYAVGTSARQPRQAAAGPRPVRRS